LLWQIKGESSVAIDDYQNGALMAIDQINSAGGVGGKPVNSFRVPATPLDPQANLSDFLQAVSKSPNVMIGLAAPTQEQQLANQITRTQIPVINTDTGDKFTANGTSGGSPYSWFLGPFNPSLVSSGISYMTGQLHLSKIGLMGTNEAYGNEGVQSATSDLQAKGLKPFAVSQYSPTATDLTQQVLSMKGADGVFNWGYPNPVAVQLNQFVQNGINIPTMTGVSVDVAISGGLVKGQALANTYVSQPCDLNAPSYSPQLSDFVSKYKAKYGNVPSQNAAWAYDGVQLAVAAIKAAKSDSPTAINAQLGKITYPGTCATYHADGANFLAHQTVISKWNASGTDQVVQQTNTTPQAKGV
jgi:ABC-type branched-subunit amino acid transport system substrate-binding protein